MRLAFFSSFNVDYLISAIERNEGNSNIQILRIPYGQYSLLDYGSQEIQELSDVVVYEMYEHWLRDAVHSGVADIEEFILKKIDQMVSAIARLLANTNMNVYFVKWRDSSSPISNMFPGIWGRVSDYLNSSVAKLNIEIIDVDTLYSRSGSELLQSEKYWVLAKSPFSSSGLSIFAQYFVELFRAKYYQNTRAIVVDLDDTLWSGTLAEVGVSGIQMSGSFPGVSYRMVQKVLKIAKERGVILAICSKNSIKDVQRVFESREDCLLKITDFVDISANFEPKPERIIAIVNRLGLRPSSVLFIDDNPLEREEVKARLPEMQVLDLDDDRSSWWKQIYDRINLQILANQNTNSSEKYNIRYKISSGIEKALSRNDFLKSLNIRVVILPANNSTLARCQELLKKTNQFNVSHDPVSITRVDSLYSVAIVDDIGSDEVVGCIDLEVCEDHLNVRSMVLSCRVLGRGVEEAMVGWIARKINALDRDFATIRYQELDVNKKAIEFLRKECCTEMEEFKVYGEMVDRIPEWLVLEEEKC